MVLGTLMTLVGRHLIIQKILFLVGKTDIESMLDESIFGAATEMRVFVMDNGPELSLAPEPFWKSIFTS